MLEKFINLVFISANTCSRINQQNQVSRSKLNKKVRKSHQTISRNTHTHTHSFFKEIRYGEQEEEETEIRMDTYPRREGGGVLCGSGQNDMTQSEL